MTKLYDGYGNVITALGTTRDKSRGNVFIQRPRLTTVALEALYESNGLASRIVDQLPDDATREDVTFSSVDRSFDFSSIQSELDDLDVLPTLADGWRWSRLYGGALVILIVNDGKGLESPLNMNNVTKLSSLQVVESPFVRAANFNPGLGSRAFRNPEFYTISVPFGTGGERKIHRSRVIRFDGVRIPPTRYTQEDGWGPSVLDRVIEELENLGVSIGYGRNILHEISCLVLKLTNFRSMLSGTPQDEQNVRTILQNLRENMDVLNVLALDKEDEIVEMNRTVTGLCDLLDKFVDALVRSTGMPRTVLLGEQPGGMNANADSEFRSWYTHVASKQKKVLRVGLNRVLEVLFAVRKRKNKPVPEEWKVEFPALWQDSEKDQSESYFKRSQADQINIMNGVISPEEARAGHINRNQIVELDGPEEPVTPLEGEEGAEIPTDVTQ